MSTIQLTIETPCDKNWASMQPAEQGRFCSACEKNVVDFTGMSNNEVYNTILKSDATICGRFNNSQLQQPLPLETGKKQRWHNYFFSFLVPALLFSRQAVAQQKIGKVKATLPIVNTARMGLVAYAPVQNKFTFSGVVKDAATSEIIANATVQVKDGAGVITDTTGRFLLTAKTGQQKVTIVISAIGFANREIEIAIPADGFAIANEIISLHKFAKTMDAVVVNSGGYNITVGLMRCVTTIKTYKVTAARLKTAINDSIKIFPNPVQRGSSFSVALKLKPANNYYTLQVVDATGRLVLQQQINASAKLTTQNIKSSEQWSGGIYFIRIIGNGNKLISASRFVVE
ncbi:carboxypeptidase-like regulatory domain-containing protein [Ferruginibacter paludis]|uniref:carboxypeptidase-like regulatory domain-containing protein n=1 Tax=Ferruginibacter paludis TaxID=1310417 RepID=UPI0025B3B06C|nr:carboxypeptidase-like regulatory domain-containing protein [Ferruginibacter paludis]MDN3659184.1 carboxypeptidase-like regulatory domain-containing protein [Ferruginibacter paludis]